MATKSDLPPLADYLPPVVAALKARGGSATIEELEEDVGRLMKLTEEQRAVEHGSGNRTYFEYRLAWARSYLKKQMPSTTLNAAYGNSRRAAL